MIISQSLIHNQDIVPNSLQIFLHLILKDTQTG